MGELLDHCKERAARRDNFNPRWWWQGWSPGHGELTDEIAALWVPVAARFDGICFHAYHNVENVTNDTLWYARTFPGKPLLLGEWNTDQFPGDRDRRGRPHPLAPALARGRLPPAPRLLLHLALGAGRRPRPLRHRGQRGAAGRLGWPLPAARPTTGRPRRRPPPPPDRSPSPCPTCSRSRSTRPATSGRPRPSRSARPSPRSPARPAASTAPYSPAPSPRAARTTRARSAGTSGPATGSRRSDSATSGTPARCSAGAATWGRSAPTTSAPGRSTRRWAWWDEFPGNPTDPNDPHRWDVMGWLTFRARFIGDHGYATRYAAARLLAYQRSARTTISGCWSGTTSRTRRSARTSAPTTAGAGDRRPHPRRRTAAPRCPCRATCSSRTTATPPRPAASPADRRA